HHTEAGPEMSALHAHHINDEIAQFGADLLELFFRQGAQIGRERDLLQQWICGSLFVHGGAGGGQVDKSSLTVDHAAGNELNTCFTIDQVCRWVEVVPGHYLRTGTRKGMRPISRIPFLKSARKAITHAPRDARSPH